MSGGSLDYACHKINYVIDELNEKLKDNFKSSIGEQYESDNLYELNPEQREQFVQHVQNLVKDLRYKAEELHHLEWFLSGDYGYDSYTKAMNELEENQ